MSDKEKNLVEVGRSEYEQWKQDGGEDELQAEFEQWKQDGGYEQWKADKARRELDNQRQIDLDEEVVMVEEVTKTIPIDNKPQEEKIIYKNNEPQKEVVEKKVLTKKEKLKRNWLSESMLNAMLLVFMSALLTLICLAPVGYLMYKKVPKPIGIIDVQEIVNENQRDIISAFSNSEYISEQQKVDSLNKAQMFTAKLNKAVEDVSEECGCVLINKAAVLTEAKSNVMVDYTDTVRNKVK